jgi:photosystem II stability/assembly factor-like uncharacterized protein
VRGYLFAAALLISAPSPAAPDLTADAGDRAWEETSYGAGEVDFTAAAFDPDDPRRIYAAARGRLFVSADGGRVWRETFSLRRGARKQREGDRAAAARRRALTREDLLEEAREESREEAVEEVREQIAEELVDELGDFGEVLAEEFAEDVAEETVEQDRETTEGEIARDVQREVAEGEREDEEAESQAERRPAAEARDLRRVHRIVAAPGGRVLLCTARGLYLSTDRGGNFEELPFGAGDERDVRGAAFAPDDSQRIWAATSAGLFESRDGGETFAEASGRLAQLAVRDVAAAPGRVFAATSRGVYAGAPAPGGALEYSESLLPPGAAQREFAAVAVDPREPQLVFAGSAAGLYRSADGGASWDLLQPAGLVEARVNDLEAAPWGLVAATRNGIYWTADHGATFRELFAGLDARDARAVAAAGPLEILAATAQGLYAFRVSARRAEARAAMSDVRRLERSEPTVAQVMERALGAAFLEHDLYPGWVRRSRLAGWAPQLSLRGAFTRPARDFASLPGDAAPTLIRDLRSEWTAFAFAEWSLDRLFDPSPETAAGRTWRRLRRQRERILDRANNTYQARRRLQIALLHDPPEELHALALKQLRVQELTARLDALTGGWFSDNIRREDAP